MIQVEASEDYVYSIVKSMKEPKHRGGIYGSLCLGGDQEDDRTCECQRNGGIRNKNSRQTLEHMILS